MAYEPLHHKYRPQTFAELVGQEAIAATLTSALRQRRIAPAYLFTGARGTGKTSSARILAKSLNCLQSNVPTEKPCGVCEVCRAIAKGSALDVIEIDAASNTGVDNIRELIERSQFAPVQCRYKVYVIDECLTGESLILTKQGLVRIDDPAIVGQQVLSYNESLEHWELKEVTRWFDQGERQTFAIETTQGTIKCTGNHLIRTETGWTAAKDVSAGTKILSPASVDAVPLSTNLALMGALENLPAGTSSKEIHPGKEITTSVPFLRQLSRTVRTVLADVQSGWKFLALCRRKATESMASCLTGNDIPTSQNTESGKLEQRISSQNSALCHLKQPDSFTAPYWETVPSAIQISTVAFLDWLGLTESLSRHGWNTKPCAYQSCDPNLAFARTKATVKNQSVVELPAIPSLRKSSKWLGQRKQVSKSLEIGSIGLPQKDWLGGTWTMALSASVPKAVHAFRCTPKDILLRKINLWLTGSQSQAIPRNPCITTGLPMGESTVTSQWGQTPRGSGYQILDSTQFPQWTTNLATVQSVRLGGVERVYDIEVEDNHNFVANGLLVHNCHMLSSAAFNALLKTLEEPPDRVVFVLATTDPQRVLPTIISRCQRFDFRRIPLEPMVTHLSNIAQREAIAIAPEAVQLVAQLSQGGLRDAESLLDQLSLLEGEITIDRVWELVGAVPERDLLTLIQAIATNDSTTVIDQARYLMDRGREPLTVLQNLASFYRDLLIAKTSPDRQDLVAITPPTWRDLCQFAQTLDIRTILLGQQRLRQSEVQVKNSTQPRLWLEVTLMELLPSAIGLDRIEAAHLGQAVQPSNGRVVQPRAAQISPVLPAQPQLSEAIAPPAIPAEPLPSAPSIGAIDPIDPPLIESHLEAELLPPAEPTSQPPQEVNRTEPSAQDDAAALQQTWDEILGQLQRLTHALFRQQGCLMAFDGAQARVGIRSQPLFAMAKQQLPSIEAAFERLYGHKVRVSVEVNSLMPALASSASASPPSASPPSASPPSASPPSASSSETPVARDRSSAPDRPANPTVNPTVKESDSPLAPRTRSEPSQSDRPTYSASPESASNFQPLEEDDLVSKAAKSLAQMFNGQIVDMEDEATVDATAHALTVAPPDLIDTEIDPDDSDDNVPF